MIGLITINNQANAMILVEVVSTVEIVKPFRLFHNDSSQLFVNSKQETGFLTLLLKPVGVQLSTLNPVWTSDNVVIHADSAISIDDHLQITVDFTSVSQDFSFNLDILKSE